MNDKPVPQTAPATKHGSSEMTEAAEGRRFRHTGVVRDFATANRLSELAGVSVMPKNFTYPRPGGTALTAYDVLGNKPGTPSDAWDRVAATDDKDRHAAIMTGFCREHPGTSFRIVEAGTGRIVAFIGPFGDPETTPSVAAVIE